MMTKFIVAIELEVECPIGIQDDIENAVGDYFKVIGPGEFACIELSLPGYDDYESADVALLHTRVVSVTEKP
jgi:hypothetical protein